MSTDNERTPLIQHHDHHRASTTSGSITPSSSMTACANGAAKNVQEARSTKRKLWFAVSLACMFFVTELVAGYFANSLALMSDAFHLLSDVASFFVALIAIYLAERPPTKRHTYGFHRAEVIAAVISVITIWVLTAFLVHEAIQRVLYPQEINAPLMCVTAAIGVGVNVILAIVLGGHHHHHHHHDEEDHNGHHHDENINLRAAALHVLGDLLASVGVLISSVVLLFKPTFTIVDPICTFVFALIVLYTTFHLITDSVGVLMEGAPGHLKPEAIIKSLTAIPGVIAVHDLHVWTLSPGKTSLTAHILVEKDAQTQYDDVLYKSQRVVCDEFGVHHSTLQIESEEARFTSHCRPEICSARV
ncbi:zinc transporter 2-like [Lichtheimia corymbifera JMRC:FSU:9682]|uniref:Zinc transporter 2-like n=1 Tax=Lichtheimia corymbifera JMRC:FSU:9682 TaxID=1263082 RepID=A0A068SFS3_9FUNG|nr:zinc transporter 2-like [Lichtheimia corymbifera JMRC:FSU:9682]